MKPFSADTLLFIFSFTSIIYSYSAKAISLIVCENSAMKRILLVKTSSLGDVIHNLPVIHDILKHHPDAQFDWVVEEGFADIPKLHPNVDEVFTVAVRRWKKHVFALKTWQEIIKCKRSLSSKAYDLVLDTQGLVKSAILTSFAQGVKHGYDKNSIREPFASRFYDQTYDIPYQQHAINRVRTLAAMSLGYPIPTDAPNYGIKGNAVIEEKLATELKAPYMMALHATSKDSKLWPKEEWVKLGFELNQQHYKLVLPWASETELARAKWIAERLPNALVLPKLSIAKVATVIANAKASIGVDTGLSHLSAALSIPTVAVYTDTKPELTGVMASSEAEVINLGGKHQTPPHTEVLASIQTLLSN
jgi:heptosyltransferase-1